MFPKGDVWSTLMFLLLLTTGARTEKICSVHSNHEVNMGSSFQIYCIFKKECKRLIYQDEVPLNYSSLNSSVVIMSIENLTRTTTFTCKCQNDPEPCGTDIVPGYPPAVPQNLTCIQEGEFGHVKCTWKTGQETHIKTTSHLWVLGLPPVHYESVAVHEGTRSASFPVSGTKSRFSVWIHVKNSLGTVNSTVFNFTLYEIVKPRSPQIRTIYCSSTQCQLSTDNTQNIQLIEIRYRKKQGSWTTVSFENTNSTTSWAIGSLNPYSMYAFEVRWKLSPTKGLWSEWTQIKGMTDEEAFLPHKVSHTLLNNHSVALYWPRTVGADPVTEFLVEWFPVGQKQHLQWIRVDKHINTAHITGLQPAQCYEGAVVYLHSSWTKKAIFNRIATWQTAPQQSPASSIDVKSESVKVEWREIPPEKRGGCLQHYTIYLKDSTGKIQNYSVPHPQREFIINGLILGQKYRLWVSAWTTAGESPVANEHPFKPKRFKETLDEKPLALLISVGSAVSFTCLCLLCLCQFSSGEMKLQLYLSDSSINEEEPNMVEVEEFSQETLPEDKPISNEETLHLVDTQAESAPYQHKIISSYLKSFSNESSSSDATQASRSTDISVDYISTHKVISGEEEEEEEDSDGDEDHETFEFFPCHRSPFLEPLITDGGLLTLDSVKIDCSDFLDCV
ncbi:Interleukin-12 receptor subunit beta-2 [Bagarius yarrelli]|uniref:Interleukin-12 receptor subunit beta-2 n=1 Tax=Bagarius yarrelli TaxID=175774 RepID=A0A556TY08_BAGYA|nr:Interleukin-12 receptor subunit beta-2 [Bagarius yarrelli]